MYLTNPEEKEKTKVSLLRDQNRLPTANPAVFRWFLCPQKEFNIPLSEIPKARLR